MTTSNLLGLVDAGEFRQLFIDQLGWNNPDKQDLRLTVGDEPYVLNQVAGYRGLRVWRCDELPDRRVQREIDRLVGKDNLERLVIFVGPDRQEWRWPRRKQSGVNAKLLMHRHVVGHPDTHLDQQLRAIEIDLDEDLTLVNLLNRMRAAFDVEAESASVQAARHMKWLYEELQNSKVGADDATLLLARLLFLLFGDDGGMWKKDLFHSYLVDSTTANTLHDDLMALFEAVNSEESGRRLRPGSPLADFRYINGGLFGDSLLLPRLTPRFREGLLAACEFDWQLISPAVFGSMFQTIKDREARRSGGEHYTTEENILRTIRPLFLDDLERRLQGAWDDKGQLTRLHNHLGQLRIFDPACGCGNFLVVAYRELRALELELLKRRRELDELDGTSTGRDRSQLTLDVTQDIQVTLDHFFGIEVLQWPARIAETAMLLVDHLANQRMEEEFGLAPDRLPIKLAPAIRHGNALHVDWKSVLPPSGNVIVVGNPPFAGQTTRNAAQTKDMKVIWGGAYARWLDYVTCWYLLAAAYLKDCGPGAQAAFVSTNSIVQGDQVARLWQPLLDRGLGLDFAWRPFTWTSEATDQAAVHVVIIGFSIPGSRTKQIFTVRAGNTIEAVTAKRLNPYLLDAPTVLVRATTRPLSPSLPPIDYGSKPADGRNFQVSKVELASLDPVAQQYLRPYIGAKDVLNGTFRYCLWLADVTSADKKASPFIRERLAAVRKSRIDSGNPPTVAMADQSHRFFYDKQPTTRYLAVPRHVSAERRWFTPGYMEAEVIASDAVYTIGDPDGFVFGLLSSAMFTDWLAVVGGRIKSDFRFSGRVVYNTFPLPDVTAEDRRAIIAAAKAVLQAREGGRSLARLYEPGATPAALVAAHNELDEVVDQLFLGSALAAAATTEIRLANLFERYADLAPSADAIDDSDDDFGEEDE